MMLRILSLWTSLLIILGVILFVFVVSFLIRIAVLVLMILAIIWLWKNIQEPRGRK